MKFLDQARVYVKSGAGGGGAVSFHREKYIEFGGPDGGNGGRGGDVWVEAVSGLNTLIDYRYMQHYKAKTGIHGMGRNRNGAKGEDITLKVPVGTQIFEEDNETLITDLTEEGERYLLAEGGNGGFGNAHFKTSSNQAPRNANPGQPALERWVWLRLKVIADVGLVGLPNAGKSTFLATVSAARPKIADYPFTTLHPNLGVARADARECVIADIPGLIEGANEGVGIGTRFLGHVERTRVLLHLVSGTEETEQDAVKAYKTVRKEMQKYGQGLDEKFEILALTKSDAIEEDALKKKLKALQKASGQKPHVISAVTHQGVKELLHIIMDKLDEMDAIEAAKEQDNRWQKTSREIKSEESYDGEI